ncbi:histidinol-phosphate transaminase [Demequina lutea]|uniref:Aromatic amino acid aminotransferase n=1 Tax=Demequina lutea TaxID=431489 RepID=A0A7Y9ZG82_9MICO|nr:histidinol-phosphate transaminase [Demequina lutea]NYI42791.1 histidinol-phosphate aminotransferase [Demequina lutea]
MTTPQPLPNVAALPPYVPGARGLVNGVTPIKSSSNENPLPPLPSVLEALATAGASIHRYPDMYATDLVERLAERHGVTPAEVVVGGGSVSALAHVLQAYAGPGNEVVFAWRSFEAYPILTLLTGASPVTVPLDADARHDLPAMAAAITERTKVVMVCSPNNPTGPSVHTDEFVAFMGAVPEHVVVVLDEAYLEYVTDPETVHGQEMIGRWPNLVVLRTFSKAYGLAGLRVGYAIAPAAIITAVRSCVTPFSVSGVAQFAAIASLDALPELLERVDGIVAERARVVAALAADGWNLPDSQGNFVWIAAGDKTAELVAHFGAQPRPILVRPFTNEGVRLTIGTPAENDAALSALAGLTWRA